MELCSEADGFLYDQIDIGTEVNGKPFVELRASRAELFKELKACYPDQADALDRYNTKLKTLGKATKAYVLWSVCGGVLKRLIGPSLLRSDMCHLLSDM